MASPVVSDHRQYGKSAIVCNEFAYFAYAMSNYAYNAYNTFVN